MTEHGGAESSFLKLSVSIKALKSDGVNGGRTRPDAAV